MKRVLALVVVLMMVSAEAARAQQRDSIMRAAVAGNWYVRVNAGADVREGRAQLFQHDTLTVAGVRMPAGSVTMIQRRFQSGGGAMVGGISGGVLLAGFGLLIADYCDNRCDSPTLLFVSGGAVLGGLFGSLLGRMLDPPDYRYREVWP